MDILTSRELSPFDRTYANVTADIESEAGNLPAPDSGWLLTLVGAFQHERQQWNSRPELVTYSIRWTRFRSKLLRLVAGAYLHIAYDLPRALADDWPGNLKWAAGPSKLAGQTIYFRIGSIFPDNMLRSARDRHIVGAIGLVFSRLPDKMMRSGAIWVDDLRKGAWLHAEILASALNRRQIEMAMAAAITAALEDASDFRPLSIMRLLPPDDAVYASSWATLLAISSLLADWVGRSLSIAIIASWLTSKLYETRLRRAFLGDFIELWGRLTSDYVAYAVREPEGFPAYRQRRRAELGAVLPLEGGTSRT